ncbi:MAG: ATP-binding protein [Anaerolineales bacterium]|jgi:signal transduction histidine kinase
MASFFQPVFTILTTNPGNLAYHLVLAFSIAGALQLALSQSRSADALPTRRLALGLGLLLVVRLALFVSGGLAWEELFRADLLPPIDRAASLLSLILIAWLWAFPTPQRIGDAATILLCLLGLTFFVISLIWWGEQEPGSLYNGSWPDAAGGIFSLAIIVLGAVLLLLKKPAGWGMALSMLGLLLIGHLAHLLAPLPQGDYPGAIRLSQMAAYPLLLALTQSAPSRRSTVFQNELSPPDLGALNMAVLDAFAPHPHGTSIETLHQQITKGVALLMGADACVLVSLPSKQNIMTVKSGYNHSLDQVIQPKVLDDQNSPPVPFNSLRAGIVLNMPANLTATELPDFGPAIGLRSTGCLLTTPIYEPGTEPDALILVALNSERDFCEKDQARLVSYAELVSRVLEHAADDIYLRKELVRIRAELVNIQSLFSAANLEKEKLSAELEESRHISIQEQSRSESLAALVANQDVPQQVYISELQAEIKRLKEAALLKNNSSTEAEHFETELRLALEEIAHLNKRISEADQKYLQLQSKYQDASSPVEKYEQIASISQDLRQPMSSIIGYTDLLLGESIGILGALQRKFLERIRVSSERMAGLVEDLMEKTILENGSQSGSAQSVDISPVIDDAIALSMSQLREKNIALRVDLPEEIPGLNIDRESLQQILLHLLQNAGSATPAEGQISLRASVTKENSDQEYLLLQISDSGSGVSAEDLPRVFSRLYRADNNPIQGVGDTGIGLAIAKALVEAQRGRIWVDTDIGRGSTFSVLLPVSGIAKLRSQEGSWE